VNSIVAPPALAARAASTIVAALAAGSIPLVI
jgi:hypothetical protein